jgi:hypothetical protein
MTRYASTRMTVLWLLLLPFAIWGAHFLAAYVVTAIQCAKSSDPAAAIPTVRWIVTGLTLAALAGLVGTLRYGRNYCRRESSADPENGVGPGVNNGDSPRAGNVPVIDQVRFVWALLLMMSALSALAILYAAAVVFFFGDCR